MRPLIVTFVSSPYISVGWNWLYAIHKVQPDADLLVVALDSETKDAFGDSSVDVLFRPLDEGNLGELWVHRLDVLIELLDHGRDIVHSDADAVWVKNPLPLMQGASSDMVFSQGTVWPTDVHGKRGIVLCCGLFFLRNTPEVRDFLGRIGRRVAEERDDQVSINRELDDILGPWHVEEPYSIEFRGTRFTASRELMSATSQSGISVAVIPHHVVPRIITMLGEQVMVAHPFSGKTCEEKEQVLSGLGLWEPDQSPDAIHEKRLPG